MIGELVMLITTDRWLIIYIIAAVRSKTVAESVEYKTDQHKSSFEGRQTEIAAGQGFLRNEIFVPYIVTQPR
jgi:hypothetical protein